MNNPYAPPKAIVADDVEIDPAIIALREKHLAHEASIRSAGMLYYFGGVLTIGSGAAGLATLAHTADAVAIGMGIGFMLLGIAALAVGFWLRRLNRKARIGAGILSTLGLLAFPVGTLVNAYILYLLFAPKGRTVFSNEYAHARELTPHLRYRTPMLVLALVAILLLAIVLVLVLEGGGMPD